MASAQKNLSDYSSQNLGNISNKRFAVVVAEWNQEITEKLLNGAFQTLLKEGAKEEIYLSKQCLAALSFA